MSLKEQVLILKVQYDEEYDRPPHTWDWSALMGSDHLIEVLNHGGSVDSEE